jgi:hypothetical protein
MQKRNAFSSIVSDDRMVGEYKDLEERVRNPITYYSRICMEGLKKIMKSFSVCLSRLKYEQGVE